jgi:cytochrome c-550 PedF
LQLDGHGRRFGLFDQFFRGLLIAFEVSDTLSVPGDKPMKSRFFPVAQRAIILLAGGLTAMAVMAHGDVVPQAVDTHTLPQLGAKWLDANPYNEQSPARKEALRIGTSAYNQNCARCHGLEAISGGISPDLRKIDSDCTGLADAVKKAACFKEMDDYFISTVRRGRVRDGRVYMPPFEGTLTQEAIWTIRSYIETRREP